MDVDIAKQQYPDPSPVWVRRIASDRLVRCNMNEHHAFTISTAAWLQYERAVVAVVDCVDSIVAVFNSEGT